MEAAVAGFTAAWNWLRGPPAPDGGGGDMKYDQPADGPLRAGPWRPINWLLDRGPFRVPQAAVGDGDDPPPPRPETDAVGDGGVELGGSRLDVAIEPAVHFALWMDPRKVDGIGLDPDLTDAEMRRETVHLLLWDRRACGLDTPYMTDRFEHDRRNSVYRVAFADTLLPSGAPQAQAPVALPMLDMRFERERWIPKPNLAMTQRTRRRRYEGARSQYSVPQLTGRQPTRGRNTVPDYRLSHLLLYTLNSKSPAPVATTAKDAQDACKRFRVAKRFPDAPACTFFSQTEENGLPGKWNLKRDPESRNTGYASGTRGYARLRLTHNNDRPNASRVLALVDVLAVWGLHHADAMHLVFWERENPGGSGDRQDGESWQSVCIKVTEPPAVEWKEVAGRWEITITGRTLKGSDSVRKTTGAVHMDASGGDGDVLSHCVQWQNKTDYVDKGLEVRRKLHLRTVTGQTWYATFENSAGHMKDCAIFRNPKSLSRGIPRRCDAMDPPPELPTIDGINEKGLLWFNQPLADAIPKAMTTWLGQKPYNLVPKNLTKNAAFKTMPWIGGHEVLQDPATGPVPGCPVANNERPESTPEQVPEQVPERAPAAESGRAPPRAPRPPRRSPRASGACRSPGAPPRARSAAPRASPAAPRPRPRRPWRPRPRPRPCAARRARAASPPPPAAPPRCGCGKPCVWLRRRWFCAADAEAGGCGFESEVPPPGTPTPLCLCASARPCKWLYGRFWCGAPPQGCSIELTPSGPEPASLTTNATLEAAAHLHPSR